MAILDTFYLLFKADTTQLTKGSEDVLNSLNKLKSAVLAAIPVGFFTAGIKHAMELGVEISRTSRILNVNVQDLQAWRNAVELAGGSAAGFESTVSSLATKFGTSSDMILKILPRYADALSRVNPSRAMQIGKNLGLDEGTILLLQQGRREVESMINRQKELAVVTQKGAEQYIKYDQATIKVKQSTQALFSVLALEVLPYMIKFFSVLDEGIRYFIQHKDFVIGGLYAIGAALGVIAVRAIIAGLPFYLMSALIIGLIGLFALLYDDYQAFLKGNGSVLGYIIEKYPVASGVIKKFFDTIREGLDVVLHPLETLEKRLKSIQDIYNRVFQNSRTAKLSASFGSLQQLPPGFNPAAGLNGAANKTTNVTIGDVTVNTQATNAQGIAADLAKEMNSSFSQVANYFADGVSK